MSGINLDDTVASERFSLVNAALERMTASELADIIETATRLQQERQRESQTQLIEKWRLEASELGVDFDALFSASRRGGRSNTRQTTIAAKYRGPDGETWSGRGHPPRWLATLEKGGHNREEFLIQADVG
jgi:DNA-binding protein H-NS